MGNPGFIIFFLICLVLEASASPRHPRHRDVPSCGNVSYIEKGRVPNKFLDIVTDRTCRTIETVIPTELILNYTSFGCHYNIEAYSDENCNTNSVEIYPFEADLKFAKVKLNNWRNRAPVCSFKVNYAPNPGDLIYIKFFDPNHNDKVHNVTSVGCYNLCGSSNDSPYYPYTVQLKLIQNRNRDILTSYNAPVQIYSTSGCGYFDDYDKDENSEIGEVRNFDDLVSITSRIPAIRSYMIFRKRFTN